VLLKDFILHLQEIYKSYPRIYKEVEGEPEIAMELNVPVKGPGSKHLRVFNGITPEIKVTKTPEGILMLRPSKQVRKPQKTTVPPKKG